MFFIPDPKMELMKPWKSTKKPRKLVRNKGIAGHFIQNAPSRFSMLFLMFTLLMTRLKLVLMVLTVAVNLIVQMIPLR